MPPNYPIQRCQRKWTTCLSCRTRKIRCDRNKPCANCIKRTITCIYAGPQSSKSQDASSSSDINPKFSNNIDFRGPPRFSAHNTHFPINDSNKTIFSTNVAKNSEIIDVPKNEFHRVMEKLATMERIRKDLESSFRRLSARAQLRHSSSQSNKMLQPEGVFASGILKNNAVHFGSHSALKDIVEKFESLQHSENFLPTDEILAHLLFENQSTLYPFVDLWSSDPMAFNVSRVCDMLPSDIECRKFFAQYKMIATTLYPVLTELDIFEQKVETLLEGRQTAGGIFKPEGDGPLKPFGVDLDFLGLFFAVCASGCQFSGLSLDESQEISRKLVSCAYQCLRMTSYITYPNIVAMQTLLIITDVLSNNFDAGASYSLLGMTERMCLALGLHVDSEIPKLSRQEQRARKYVWWMMAYSNSHFSLAYDRPSITMLSQPQIPFDESSMAGRRSYFETICRLTSIALEVLRARMEKSFSLVCYNDLRRHQSKILSVISETAPHLRFRVHCHNLVQHIERIETRLFSSYLISNILRVSLNEGLNTDPRICNQLRMECISSLLDTVESYIDLCAEDWHTSRSWINIQRALGAVFLLLIHDNGPKTLKVTNDLEEALTRLTEVSVPSQDSSSINHVKQISQSLKTLRRARNIASTQYTSHPANSTSSNQSLNTLSHLYNEADIQRSVGIDILNSCFTSSLC